MFEVIPNWHPFVVHFVIAPGVIALLCFLVGYFLQDGKVHTDLLSTAKWSLYILALAAVLALITGWFAFTTVAHDDAGHAAMSLHRLSAIITLLLILVSAAIYKFTQRSGVKLWFLGLLVVMTISLLLTGYLGAENVYRHGIGVLRMPDVIQINSEDNHHSHDHHH